MIERVRAKRRKEARGEQSLVKDEVEETKDLESENL